VNQKLEIQNLDFRDRLDTVSYEVRDLKTTYLTPKMENLEVKLVQNLKEQERRNEKRNREIEDLVEERLGEEVERVKREVLQETRGLHEARLEGMRIEMERFEERMQRKLKCMMLG
jgi:hypothetical protein